MSASARKFGSWMVLAGQVHSPGQAAAAAQAVELEDEVLLAGGREERQRGVQLGSVGATRQGLVAEDRARLHVDDGLVDRVDPALQHHLEDLLAPAAGGDHGVELGLVAGLAHGRDHLGLGADRRVAQRGARPEAQRGVLLQVGVADAHAAPPQAVHQLAPDLRKLDLVELGLARFPEEQYQDLVAAGLPGDDQVVDTEALTHQVVDQGREVLHGAPVGLAAVLALDHHQARRVHQDDAQRPLQREMCGDTRARLSQGGKAALGGADFPEGGSLGPLRHALPSAARKPPLSLG